jgi:hypothetical protein
VPRFFALLVLALPACAPAPPPADAPASTGRAVDNPAPTHGDPAALPPPPSAPGPVVCTFEHVDASFERLALVPGGPSFASISGGVDMRVELIDSPEWRGARVGAQASGVTIQGLATADVVELEFARPTLIAGVFVPKAFARFDWRGAGEGKLAVSIGMERLAYVRSAALTTIAEHPCTDFAVEADDYEPLAAIGAPTPERAARLKAGHDVRFAPAPRAAAVAEFLVPANESPEVDVIDSRGAEARVVLDVGDGLLIGWVPSAELAPRGKKDAGRANMFGGVVGGLEQQPGNDGRREVCSRNLPLSASVAGATRMVGSIGRGTPFVLGQSHDAYAAIQLERRAWSAADLGLAAPGQEKRPPPPAGNVIVRDSKADLLVPKADLDACHPL